MIKRPLIYSIIFSLLLIGCATKSYVRFEDEHLYERTEQTDSSIFQQIETEKIIQFQRQDSLFTAI
ncbi:MAG: hypothetical protein KAT14_07200, partial [Candidatus Marinimicrobia bacterium]|nr:hypothetical protein [Candidatus Neomarinimicrobiota bacterium]